MAIYNQKSQILPRQKDPQPVRPDSHLLDETRDQSICDVIEGTCDQTGSYIIPPGTTKLSGMHSTGLHSCSTFFTTWMSKLL